MADNDEKLFSLDHTPKGGYVQLVDGSDQLSIFWSLLWHFEFMKRKSPTHLCAKTRVNHIRVISNSVYRTLENIAITRKTRMENFMKEGYPGLGKLNSLAISYHPREIERNPPQLLALCLNTVLDMLDYFPNVHLPVFHGTICANDVHEALEIIPEEYIKENAESDLAPP